METEHPGLQLAESLGFQMAGETLDDDLVEVSLQGIRSVKHTSSDGPDPSQRTPQDSADHPKRTSSDDMQAGPPHTFERGDKVTVVRKMTWEIPLDDSPKYRGS